jgi:hypothetical protein
MTLAAPPIVPARIGPVEFGVLGGMIAVRLPERRPAGCGSLAPTLADRAEADWVSDPQPAPRHRSAVSPRWYRPGRRGMTRIVTTAYRYKRPPRKRKAVALDMPPTPCSAR